MQRVCFWRVSYERVCFWRVSFERVCFMCGCFKDTPLGRKCIVRIPRLRRLRLAFPAFLQKSFPPRGGRWQRRLQFVL